MDKFLRVLYYNHTGEVSGAEISLLTMVKAVQNQIEPFIASPEGELLQRAKRLGLPTFSVKGCSARMTSNPFGLAKGLLGMYHAGKNLSMVIDQVRPDLVHANSIRAGLIATIALSRINERKSKRLIWHVRDQLPINLPGRIIRRVAERRADGIVAVSQAIARNFADNQRLRNKCKVIYNGVDLHQAQGRSLRPELGVPKERFVIGVVGQITPWKRQHDAILAFTRFVNSFPESELWIVGAAKFRPENQRYEEKLHELVNSAGLQDKVRFLGFRSDVMNVMSSIDVLLVPSENEPFGRVVIEAMLAGKPVIGTNGGGIPEIVVDGETGYLVPIGDVEGMEQCLVQLLPLLRKYKQFNLISSMGKVAQERVIENFSAKKTAQELIRFYSYYLK